MSKHQVLEEYHGKDHDGQCYNVPGFHILPTASIRKEPKLLLRNLSEIAHNLQ